MIVVDANLLIYAYDADSHHHTKTLAWLEKTLSGVEAVGLAWQTVSAFLRVVTNRRLPRAHLTVDQAVQVVEKWFEQPNVRMLAPADNHWILLRRMVIDGQASGPLVSDAELAALTIEYGGVLYSADRDFTRFPGLRWVNPLR